MSPLSEHPDHVMVRYCPLCERIALYEDALKHPKGCPAPSTVRRYVLEDEDA